VLLDDAAERPELDDDVLLAKLLWPDDELLPELPQDEPLLPE
jgi:hypothetical protein